ncbi:putative virulence factor [Taylorella equigenitalis]|uniref:Virulence factor n=2 Tax=Taylorella equigenitalis TaxID=29575 RepID=A0A654KFE0_TAYEM|nr:virulence factor SrfC family protein [Taylorella equigenitalis]ADU91132.1 hypothetical protein TEQUI_0178 [Taylorella equigenitalis MCE9]AFN36237.1 SrfC virulence factor protein [Taylorella equigenitalis ATCC 35865]ASY39636.1 SrfC virulence factor protein [Taylorella equigenitalis]ASY41088.1 SrfC virulence factor protein [Taylorella equigenitalis]WDU46001.1 putative virulence factor [Taylorella equigenitalis]
MSNLSESWDSVYEGAKKAIDWVQSTRTESPRVASEATSLIESLRRLRVMARKLGHSSEHPVSVGFFGLSQAGKSYLISSLAADDEGKLTTTFDGQELDFMDHINPTGGGKEATGLATRFTKRADVGIKGYPIELRLFSEIEIVKILVNSFFNDFNSNKLLYEPDQQKINKLIKELTPKAQKEYVPGIVEEDIVDLQDYCNNNFAKSVSVYKANYWTKAAQLAPHLSLEDRAELFSILWYGEKLHELTETYVQFSKILASLGHPEFVYAPIDVLVQKNEDGTFSKTSSIMNVDMVERLGKPADNISVDVLPISYKGEQGKAVNISLAQLAILTTEFIFPLKNEPRCDVVNKIDLLDFPGYRGRLELVEFDENENSIGKVILRGKVAYLFESYTDSQEMNILIMCTPSDAQLEINDVGPVLEKWIDKIQGETPQIRAKRLPALLWAFTKFDKRTEVSINTAEENLKQSWGGEGLLKQTLLERFGNFVWVRNWADGKPFNNIFLVRKPGYSGGFIETADGRDVKYMEAQMPKMEVLRSTFIENSDIQKFVANPDEKWDAMLKLNDGGMEYLSQYLDKISDPSIKFNRLTEQLNREIENVVRRFGAWYEGEGDRAVEDKKRIANDIYALLRQQAGILGEFLDNLTLPQETIRSLYFTVDFQEVKDGEDTSSSSTDFSFDGMDGIDLFEDVPTSATSNEAKKTNIAEFSQSVFDGWVDHLRGLTADENFLRYFNLSVQNKSIIDNFISEMITAAVRLKLLEKLSDTFYETERAGHKREQLASRQVINAYTHIADFISWLGFGDIAIEDRPLSKIRPSKSLFEPPVFETTPNNDKIPLLSETPEKFTMIYLMDWFTALAEITVGNAGHKVDREISPAMNTLLGEILNQFEAARIEDAVEV